MNTSTYIAFGIGAAVAVVIGVVWFFENTTATTGSDAAAEESGT